MDRNVFVGLDWAEKHHDIFIEDDDGARVASARLAEGIEGVARFHQIVSGLADHPSQVVIATETGRGLFIGALVAAGYRVLAVNPMSTSRYRERHSTSARSRSQVMPRCWPTWPAPTGTTTGPLPATAIWPLRSRRLPGAIRA